MKKRLADLACRRQVLLEKIETQRIEVAGISQRWQKPLALVDAGVKAVRFIHNHPTWVAGGVAAFLALRRKGISGLAQEGWHLLRLYPAIFSLATRSPSGKKLFAAHPEERNTGADH